MAKSRRSITVREIPLDAPTNDRGRREAIEVEVAFAAGGMSFATYKNEPRGYYVHVGPVAYESGIVPGVTMRSFVAFSGVKRFLEAAPRFNEKRLTALANDLRADSGRYEDLVTHVVTKGNLKLADAAVAPAEVGR